MDDPKHPLFGRDGVTYALYVWRELLIAFEDAVFQLTRHEVMLPTPVAAKHNVTEKVALVTCP